MRDSKKGISPIVSSLLVLLITVIAFSTALGYANNFISAQKEHTLTAIKERMVVEDIWFHVNGSISVYLTNVGNIPLSISEIHVNEDIVDFNPCPLELNKYDSGQINLYYPWFSGREYNFLIVSDGGTYHASPASAP